MSIFRRHKNPIYGIILFMNTLKNPNFITLLRVLFSIGLIFIPVLTVWFYLLYFLAGASDALDGYVARKYNATTKRGERFDSIADLIFIIVCAIKLIPYLPITTWMWVFIVFIAILRIYNIVAGFRVYKSYYVPHTYANKATGLFMFLVPFSFGFIDMVYPAVVILILALIATVQDTYFMHTGVILFKKLYIDKIKPLLEMRVTKQIVSVLALVFILAGFASSTTGKPMERLVEEKKVIEEKAVVYRADVTQTVRDHHVMVEEACEKYDIMPYKELVLALIQQESSGTRLDVMQSAESPYNTSPPIDTKRESIDVGCHQLAECLKEADCKSASDIKGISLALQGYNFGKGYIYWVKKNYDGYTRENASKFSDQMKSKLKWNKYGDKEYVPHVLRYYVPDEGEK